MYCLVYKMEDILKKNKIMFLSYKNNIPDVFYKNLR